MSQEFTVASKESIGIFEKQVIVAGQNLDYDIAISPSAYRVRE
jgi:hypothetical protein